MPGPMQDRRFYPEAKPVTAASVASLVGGDLVRGSGDTSAAVAATPDSAKPGSVCFVASAAMASQIPDVEGFICLVLPELAESIPAGGSVIETSDPKGSFSMVLKEMFPREKCAPGIDPAASVDTTAKIGKNVSIAAGAVVEANAELGPDVAIGPGAVVGPGCVIGARSRIGANSVVGYAIIGEDAEIGPLVVIGNRGFGIVSDGNNYPAQHLGRVVIGARSYIAAHSNIDRGFIKDTVIGEAVMVDTMVHIAHNAAVGDGCILCGQVGIAGSASLGRNNVLGSKSGVADNVTIGDGNMFAALSGITKDVGSGQVMGGFPAVPMSEFRRQTASMRKLGRQAAKGVGDG